MREPSARSASRSDARRSGLRARQINILNNYKFAAGRRRARTGNSHYYNVMYAARDVMALLPYAVVMALDSAQRAEGQT